MIPTICGPILVLLFNTGWVPCGYPCCSSRPFPINGTCHKFIEDDANYTEYLV